MTAQRPLDLICLGRSSVDLYGEQVGCGLELTSSFRKYVGGCATNIAVGTARLGLRSALITRVGNEQLGRFIVDTLAAEGVDTSAITVDPGRLTALVILGMRNAESFPHIFYRTDCADMAISADDIDPAFIGSASALLVTGTHFSRPGVAAASRAAIAHARAASTKVILDIDYRPVLWGVGSHAEGDSRFVADKAITETMQSVLGDCDLVVGTAEEVHIAGGETDTIAALRRIRELTGAPVVLKRGPDGCVIYPGAIPDRLEDGVVVAGTPVEVFNTLGAGDGFMSGFLRGWLRGESWGTCGAYGNGAGAIVVSRHGCAPASPTWPELAAYLEHDSPTARLSDDARLTRLHRATARRGEWPEVLALAFDHRAYFEQLCAEAGAPIERIAAFKRLVADGVEAGLEGGGSPAAIVDARHGADALLRFTDAGAWLARPIEKAGSRPLELECGRDVSRALRSWPINQIVKCLVLFHPDDAADLREAQEATLSNLYEACVDSGHELLIEVIPPPDISVRDDTMARALASIYNADVYPDWWKLPPQATSNSWQAISDVIASRDPYCRGVLLLGLNASEADLGRDFATAAAFDICKGFAVGRSIFQRPADAWFAGRIDDAQAVATIAENYAKLIDLWRAQRPVCTTSAAVGS